MSLDFAAIPLHLPSVVVCAARRKGLSDAMYYYCVLLQVTKTYSKVWSNREDGLLELYRYLQELPTSPDKDIAKNKLRAATFLIDRALKDKVFAVRLCNFCGVLIVVSH